MADRPIAAGERACAQFRRDYVFTAEQFPPHRRQARRAGDRGGRSKDCPLELHDGKVLIIPADDESTEVADDSTNSFDKIMRKPVLSEDNT